MVQLLPVGPLLIKTVFEISNVPEIQDLSRKKVPVEIFFFEITRKSISGWTSFGPTWTMSELGLDNSDMGWGSGPTLSILHQPVVFNIRQLLVQSVQPLAKKIEIWSFYFFVITFTLNMKEINYKISNSSTNSHSNSRNEWQIMDINLNSEKLK